MNRRLPPILHCALLLAFGLCLASCGRRPWNVVLFTFDTTRADSIGCYGKATAHTPHLDRLAAEGFLFEHNYASNPVTQASHSTILTGVYPMVHGVRDNTFFHLPDGIDTLAERLGARGYATGAAVGGFPLTREFGTAQGFDFYDDDLGATRSDHRRRPTPPRFATWYDERPAGHVNDAILPWLRERHGEPFFVWLHYWDPHEPHIAPAPYSDLFAHDPYEGEIAYADASLGVILRELEASGELERTLVVMTADHGEGRFEHHEATHAFLAYDATLHVPLILRVPGAEGGRRIAERVATVDIVPTVLDLLGFGVPAELQGRSLVPLLTGEAGGEDRRTHYSESLSPRLSHGAGELRVLFRGPWKYIYGPRPELFNLEEDPRELHDLAADRPELRAQLETALRHFVETHARPDAAGAAHEASAETHRRLAALGYLGATGDGGPRAVTEELRSDGAPPQDRVGDINLQIRLRNELGQGRFRLALRTARALLEIDPDSSFYRSSLATALLGLGETAEAARVVDATPELTAAIVTPFLGVARALFDAGERDRALALARRLVEVEESAETWVELGRMQLENGDAGAFEAAMARALELDAEHRAARLGLARHLTAEDRLDEAGEELRQLLATYPADTEGLLAYGRLLRRAGRRATALAEVDRVLRLAPAWCEAHLEKVSLLVELGRRAEAVAARDDLGERCHDRESRLEADRLLAEGE